MTTATEPVPAAPDVETAPEANAAPPVADGAPSTAPTTTPKAFDPEALPAEIKSFVKQREDEISKKYADYDTHRSAAQEWERVRNDPRFQQWAQSLNQPPTPQPFDITDDQFAAALSDKNQFAQLVNLMAEKLLAERVAPQLEQVNRHNELNAKVNDLRQVVSKYPDFKDLDKRGLIEPIIRKYPHISFEDAYWLARKDTLNEEADRRARGIIAGKKTAAIEKPGSGSGGRSPRVNAKNREEAMNMVAEAVRAGRPIPEFDEIGD